MYTVSTMQQCNSFSRLPAHVRATFTLAEVNMNFIFTRSKGSHKPNNRMQRSESHVRVVHAGTTTGSCIGVGAQSTLGARHFCPKIYARKNNKIPEFYMIFARKIFFPIFLAGASPLTPVSYAYGQLHRH